MKRTPVWLFLCAAIPVGAAEKIIGGPYAVNVSKTGATVCAVLEGANVKLASGGKDLPALRSQCTDLTGLQPGTAYQYEVAGAENGKGSFRTAPEGPADFQFMVFGDTRTRHDLHQKIIDAMVKSNPEFVVHTGDLITDGRDTKLWPTFFNIEKELLRKTAFFPVPGNHERNNPQYFRFFDVRRPYSSFDWGAVHFVLLDTDLGNMGDKTAKADFWAEQMRWLEQDLARAGKAALRLAIFHHPPITAVKRRQDGNEQVQTLMPVFEKYKVQAVFNGHDHNYQHHVKNGIHYIVTGGGGAPLYPVDGALEGITQKVESTEHYCTIKVTGRAARVEAIALDGHLIDTVEIK